MIERNKNFILYANKPIFIHPVHSLTGFDRQFHSNLKTLGNPILLVMTLHTQSSFIQ